MSRDERAAAAGAATAIDDVADASNAEEPAVATGDHAVNVASGSDDAGVREADRLRKPRRRPHASTVVAGLVALLLSAGAVAAGLMWHEGTRTEQRRHLAVDTAREMAVALVTVNSATADQDVQRVLDGSVGDFGKVFSENVDSYADIVRRGNVSTTGEAASAGLQKLDGTTARVLVAIKATVKNDQVPQGEERTYRMNLEMAEQPDGRWLAKNVEFVP